MTSSERSSELFGSRALASIGPSISKRTSPQRQLPWRVSVAMRAEMGFAEARVNLPPGSALASVLRLTIGGLRLLCAAPRLSRSPSIHTLSQPALDTVGASTTRPRCRTSFYERAGGWQGRRAEATTGSEAYMSTDTPAATMDAAVG